MATFRFDLVSPEKLLFSGEVNQVDVPGAEGDFGVLAGHAPLVTTLRPGILIVYDQGGGQLRIVVNGGFAEVTPTGLTILADLAVPIEEFDRDTLAGVIKDTEEDLADSSDNWQRDKLAHKVEQLKALQAALGQ
ncbi:MAG TPA: F0F1 ATP synthase subunit epsilon [Xanthobacteraceae bacterium]|jgi:F-type H+-transporting ATPase subunit epsilon